MNKRTLFVLAAIVLAGVGLYYQSEDAKTSRALVGEIVQLDAAGTDTKSNLDELKAFVKTRMGSSVSFTLTGSYNRAQAAAQASASAQNASGQVYADAQRACSGKTDSITQARCNENYIQQHLANLPSPAPVPSPKLSDYQVSLRSPLWTPDLAGALMLGAVLSLIFGLVFLRRGHR